MSSHWESIQRSLRKLQMATRQGARVEALRFGLAAVLFCLGLATIAAQIGWPKAGATVLALGMLMGVGIWGWFSRQAADLALQLRAAKLAERLAPELGSAPSSAVDLALRQQGDGETFSRRLADWHIEQTSHKLDAIDFTRRYVDSRAVWRRRARNLMLATGGFALLLLVTLDAGRKRLLSTIIEPNAVQLSDVPLAGDIQIVYRYPAYTHRQPHTVEGGDGSIRALVGTEVELSAVAFEPVREAFLRIGTLDGESTHDIPMHVEDGRQLRAKFPVLQDGRYHFIMATKKGDRLEERHTHPIRALLDAYPEIHMDAPKSDVELRDNQDVPVLWRAADDFGVSEVSLVLETAPDTEPTRIKLAGGDGVHTRREGRYKLSLAKVQIPSSGAVRFYLEAVDNDTIGGPKRSVSAARRIEIFSAKRHHEDLLAKQAEALNQMVDLLGVDLTHPAPKSAQFAQGRGGLDHQQSTVERMLRLSDFLKELSAALRDDELASEGVPEAFLNIQRNIDKSRMERQRLILLLRRENPKAETFTSLVKRQANGIAQLETDIVYLDDLLVMQRVQVWKQTAKELLSAQQDLQGLLEQYKETQDPALRAALEQRIRDLKDQMLDLMAKMAQIKQGLPSEYRNLEAASQLKLQDQMDRLEEMLRSGDLEQAAQEIEDMARMLENMMGQMEEAEQQLGEDKYADIKKELAEFADAFKRLESEQDALAKRQKEAVQQYRRKAVEQSGKNVDDFVEKARAKTADALKAVDNLAESSGLFGMDRDIQEIRQRLLDLDSLLEQRDFAEARDVAESALQAERTLEYFMADRQRHYGRKNAREIAAARKHAKKANGSTEEVKQMLDNLFPDPKQILNKEQMAQLQGMAKKQQQLEQQAQELGEQMQNLAEQLPLFGGDVQQNLDSAKGEMGEAQRKLQGGSLPQAAGHGRKAADELAKLRDALEQSSQGGQGGLPLPLGMGQRRGQGGHGGQMSREEVEIPDAPPGGGGPRFRQELLEAAKQKAPEAYEDAVRRYYEELIR